MSESLIDTDDLDPELLEIPLFESLKRIADFRVLRRIADGPTGTLYEAEQESRGRRRVALKLVQTAMDARQVVARFEFERQQLAGSDHPAIAKIYDVGVADGNRIYVAAEWVQGLPVVQHCDARRLGIRERLELFIRICEGVQHAHDNGVVHCAIRPSNVLISVRDSRPEPKITDFGVAKATARHLMEQAGLGRPARTPEYTSPEQASAGASGSDGRADIYSLGALLYELLSGVPPFDAGELRRAGMNEARRKIREEQPRAPSSRSTAPETAPTAASDRNTDPVALAKQLHGELDRITMKALAKHPEDRHGSPAELAGEVARYLARRRSGTLGEFVSRRRSGPATAVPIVVAVVIGLVGFVIGFVMPRRAGGAPGPQGAEQVQARPQTTDTQVGNSEALTGFLVDLFELPVADGASETPLSDRAILDRAADLLDKGLVDHPQVRARLMHKIGNGYRRVGDHARALPLLEQAFADSSELLGEDHPATLASMGDLAGLYLALDRLEQAEPLSLRLLEARRRSLGRDHADTLAAGESLGRLYVRLGEPGRAEPLYLEALQTRRRLLGPDHADTMASTIELADLYSRQGRYDQALPLYVETLESQHRVLGEDHPQTLRSTNRLAGLYVTSKRYSEAMSLYDELLEAQRRELGSGHPDTLTSMGSLAELYVRQGNHEQARRLLEEAIRSARQSLPGTHVVTGLTFGKYGACLMGQGLLHEAEDALLKAHKILAPALGTEHEETVEVISNLVDVYELSAAPGAAAAWRAKLRGQVLTGD